MSHMDIQTDRRMVRSMDRQDGQVDGQTGWSGRWTDRMIRSMDRQDGQVNGQMDGQVDGQTDGQVIIFLATNYNLKVKECVV